MLVAGAAGGGIWGAIPGALKAYAGVNEILSTIMMNIVAAQLLSFLLQDLLIEKGAIRIQQTKRLSENADLPLLPGGTRLHLGFVVALRSPFSATYSCFAARWGFGFEPSGTIRTPPGTQGCRCQRSVVQAMAFSGACAGVAGAMLVFGSESHRLIGEGGSAASPRTPASTASWRPCSAVCIRSSRSRRRSSSVAC